MHVAWTMESIEWTPTTGPSNKCKQRMAEGESKKSSNGWNLFFVNQNENQNINIWHAYVR